MSEAMISHAVEEASGLLLCGGTDITPALYGKEAHPLTIADSHKRDLLEIDLIRRFEALKLPILGICRGCQAIAVALGGTLHQHVPDLTEVEQHGLCETQGYANLVSSAKHKVQLEPNSFISKILGKTEIDINSAHHQAVDSSGNKLKISGRTEAGIVEFIEHLDQDQWVLGVQGHIEVEYHNQNLNNIFKAYAERVREKSKNREVLSNEKN
jgi:putative glutamine amidotransferase